MKRSVKITISIALVMLALLLGAWLVYRNSNGGSLGLFGSSGTIGNGKPKF